MEDLFTREFQSAVLGDQVERVRSQLINNPEWCGRDIETFDGLVCPLYHAVKQSFITRDTAMVRLLLAHGADLSTCNKQYVSKTGTTPLAEAAKLGYKDCPLLEVLLENDIVDNNMESRLSFTALYNAAKRGDLELVKRLVEMGFDVNWLCDDLNTALHAAACSGCVEVTKYLLGKGANVTPNNTNTLPLHLAVRYNHIELVKLLIELGADVNEGNISQYSPLMMACSCDLPDIVKVLLENGASVNNQRSGSPFHFSPLSIAAFHVNPKTVSLLLEHGADVNAENECGRTPFHIATIAAETHKSVRTLEIMIKNGAIIDKVDDLGRSPVIYSLLKGREKVAALLIKHGARLQNIEQQDTLYFAVTMPCIGPKIMDMILKAGYDIKRKPHWFGLSKLQEQLKEFDSTEYDETERNLKEKYKMLKFHLTNASSLQDFCRLKIRQLLIGVSGGKDIFPSIHSLPLTDPAIKFLCFET